MFSREKTCQTVRSMNITVNGSSSWSCSSLINLEAGKIGATVALSLLLVVSLIGNLLIVLIVYKTPTLRKPINMLIANMAMSDLLFPIFSFPFRLAYFHGGGGWLIGGNLGQALCKLHVFGTYICSLVSVQSLVLITVDRFGAVVVPLRSPLITIKQCPFFIVATWIIAMAVHSPYLVAQKLVEYPGGMSCKTQWRETFGENANRNYILVLAIVFFYTSFVLLVILYSVILIKLKRQAHPGEPSANAEEQRTRRIRSVLKMAIAIVVVFFIYWIPMFTNWTISVLSAPMSSISCSFILYDLITSFMPLANCALNPIICLIFSGNYRQALKRLSWERAKRERAWKSPHARKGDTLSPPRVAFSHVNNDRSLTFEISINLARS